MGEETSVRAFRSKNAAGIVAALVICAGARADEAKVSVIIGGPVAGTIIVDRSHPTVVAESREFPRYGSIGPFGTTTIDGAATQFAIEQTPAPGVTTLELTGLIDLDALGLNANAAYSYRFASAFDRTFSIDRTYDYSLVGTVRAANGTMRFDSSYAPPFTSASVALSGTDLSGRAFTRRVAPSVDFGSEGGVVEVPVSFRGMVGPGDVRLSAEGLVQGGLLFFKSTLPEGSVERDQQVSYSLTLRLEPHKPKTYAIVIGSDHFDIERGDIRGGLDALHVAERLTWVAPENLYYKTVNYDSSQNLEGFIRSAVQDMVANGLQPQDTLLFYYGGHGGTTGGGLTPSDPGVDETINPTRAAITDDTLTAILSDEQLALVRKVVILDSCKSGGFWNSDGFISGEGDDADLESLSNIALFAGSVEDADTFSVGSIFAEDYGTGHFTNSLLSRLTPEATFADLATTLYSSYSRGDLVEGLFRDDVLSGPGVGTWDPAAYFSFDFDPFDTLDPAFGLVVPEPGSAAALVLAAAAVTVRRRRRR